MEWTKKVPTEAGWYWWRDATLFPEVWHVDETGSCPGVLYAAMGDDHVDVDQMGGEWQGPLKPDN